MYINVCAKHIYRSRGISLCPLTRCGIVLIPVVLVQISDFGHERVVRVGIGEEGADREKHFRDGEGGRPLVLEDVEANATVRINVAVVDSGRKCTLGWLKWVVSWEANVDKEDTACVW